MGFTPWLKQELLERCLERMVKNALRKADLVHPCMTNERVVVLTESFVSKVTAATIHITDVAEGRQQYIVRACDVLHGAYAVGVKLYGYDDAPDDSRLALLHGETDSSKDVVESEPRALHLADDDIIYTAPVESSDADSSDSDAGISSEDDETPSLGDGEFSDCEASDEGNDDKIIVENPYALPRRIMLRLFRDISTQVKMEAMPITRKALSAFHNMAEALLCPLVVSLLQDLASQPPPPASSTSPSMNTTPTMNRRAGGTKRMSGDVFPPMAAASQKRKSPRLAHKSMRVHLDFHDDTKSPLKKAASKHHATKASPPASSNRRAAAA